MYDVNAELAKLYLEAVALVVKLNNKLKQAEVEGAELHISAAEEFLKKNVLYQKGIEGFLK